MPFELQRKPRLNSLPFVRAWRRRRFTAIRCAIVLCLPFLLLVQVGEAAERQRLDLAKGWKVRQLVGDTIDVKELEREFREETEPWMGTAVPAQVHDVLLQHGKISDPRVGKNATESAWVGEKEWVYACEFVTPKPGNGPVFLCFDGLDTLAKVYLNGQPIGQFDNMYRRYRIDVTEGLSRIGQANSLLVVFSSPLRFLENVQQPAEYEGVAKFHYLRKSHTDFGSYLGARPHSVKVGIFRDVWIDMPGVSWLKDAWVRPKMADALEAATIQTQIELGGADATVHWRLIDPKQKEIAEGTAESNDGQCLLKTQVPAPMLWWPRTHGTPHLYQLEVQVIKGDRCLDERVVSFGIRQVQPVLKDLDTGEARFRFDINGQPIFLRGACWAPVEGMTHCWQPERAAKLLDLLEQGHMNVLRVWGEGHIPPPEFYQECDRRGILVWQDFMFGYGMHPSGEPTYDQNCRIEIEQVIRRLRNHPCLLLWCGGNENHMGWNFRYGGTTNIGRGLFGKIMPAAVAQLDPERLFHASSPFGGRVPNWPLEGDWHDYSTLKFCPQASVPLFASEIGRASAPSLTSMRRFLSEDELWPSGFDADVRVPGQPAWPPMWQYRSVGGSWDKVGRVEDFCDPQNAEDLIHILGTAHGEYLSERIERQRRGVPDGAPDGDRRCWGNMVWRLNDSWPIIYWSLVDYYLEPKIPYYFARRAYEPVLVSFERTKDRISVWVVNDSPQPVSGTVVVEHRHFNGDLRGQLQVDVEIGAGEAKRCLNTDDFGPVYLRNEFLQASFGECHATLVLTGERYLHLPKAQLSVKSGEGKLEISSDKFARQVSIRAENVTGAVFEDNFFDLPPGSRKSVTILDAGGSHRWIVKAVNSDAVFVEP